MSLLHLSGQAGDQNVTGVNHRWEKQLAAVVIRVTKLREHNRVQRLVKVQGLGFGFLGRDDDLAQFAELTIHRQVSEGGSSDDGVDAGILFIGECVHEVLSLMHVETDVVTHAHHC